MYFGSSSLYYFACFLGRYQLKIIYGDNFLVSGFHMPTIGGGPSFAFNFADKSTNINYIKVIYINKVMQINKHQNKFSFEQAIVITKPFLIRRELQCKITV